MNFSCPVLKSNGCKKDKNGNDYEQEEKNFGTIMDFVAGIKSCISRDESSYGISHGNNEEIVCIVNSFDRAIHPVTKFCDGTILTQTIAMSDPSYVRYHKGNLSTPNNLMSIMSLNGKRGC